MSARRLPRARLLPLAATALAVTTLQAGQQSADPVAPPVFRASTDLLTTDVVVTDKDGRHVTDLTIDDFEVTHSGKRVALQQAVYVSTTRSPAVTAGQPRPAVTPGSRRPSTSGAPSAALTQALASQAPPPARTIAFVVDDLGLSWESTVYVRKALRRYVESEMAPGDLVAVVRTAGGIGALQQFTTDKRLVQMAVDRVQWTLASRRAVTAFGPIGDPDSGSLDGLRERMMAVASFGAIEFVTRGIQHLPGRKSIVLFTEGFGDIFSDRLEGSGQIWRAMARMLDRANRAGVVVYTVDARGLQSGGPSAEDDTNRNLTLLPGQPMPDQSGFIRDAAENRRRQLVGTQDVLHFIADQTGGLSFTNNNDLNLGIRRALDDLRGYYLLGYSAPEGSSRTGWDQDRVKVRVKRPGLRVRARQGFFGPATPDREQEARADDPLLIAAMSPFAGGAITVRLTSLFGHDTKAGPYIRSLLFIDPNGLSFTRNPERRHESRVEVLQAAVGDNGEVLGNWRRTITLRLTDEQLERARAEGIVYGTRMTVKKPGAYQVRTAIQDLATRAVGSASQFLEVPKVGKGRLALSGVLLQGKSEDVSAAATAASGLEFSETGDPAADVLGEPTLRIFRPGSDVVYAYEVYDGLDEKKAKALQMQTSLLRNGKVVYESPAKPVDAGRKSSRVRVIPIAGLLSLGDDMPEGMYTLEVAVGPGKDRKRGAKQWVDLEVRGR